MAGDVWDMPNQQVVWAEPPPPPTAVPAQDGFDPGGHTVDEVKTYVTAHPDELETVTAAEQAGKNRSSLLDWLANLGGTV